MKTKFAIVDGKRTEAHKGLHGQCPVCRNPVIAKCGEKNVHHWAHESVQDCDSWWENKGEWHCKWQDEFDNDWQEIIIETNGEKHIADIKTPNGLVIEFQHSPISLEEQRKREKFYKNMIWVVDCSNSKNAYKKFQKKTLFKETIEGTNFAYVSRDCFPDTWQKNTVPVIFDFFGFKNPDDRLLYRIFPDNNIMEEIYFEQFVNEVKQNTFSKKICEIKQKITQKNHEANMHQKFVNCLKTEEINKRYSIMTDKQDDYIISKNYSEYIKLVADIISKKCFIESSFRVEIEISVYNKLMWWLDDNNFLPEDAANFILEGDFIKTSLFYKSNC
jgi:hypothetical protein